jgi:type IV pilus assembly protein PilA
MLSSIIERLNDRRDASGDAGEDAGFTLIELMVVLLILAILLAIAIPTFLGVTGGANDRAAQSDLNTALTTAKSAATQNDQSYGGASGGSAPVTQALLQQNEPSIKWMAANAAALVPGDVSWYVSDDGNGIVLASPSKNGNTCWYASDNLTNVTPAATPNPDTIYGAGTAGGTTTTAPTGPGTWYSEVLGGSAANGCNASAAPNGTFAAQGGVNGWRTHGFS